MPQMGPLMWLGLMVMFVIVFFMFYSFIYFIRVPTKGKMFISEISLEEKNWRW